MVLAIDARRPGGDGWEVVVDGGRTPTGLDALAWAEEGARRGAGELLVTSMDADGQKTGYDLDLVHAVTTTVDLRSSPAAGPARSTTSPPPPGRRRRRLAASVFHFGQLSITEVKQGLAAAGLGPYLADSPLGP